MTKFAFVFPGQGSQAIAMMDGFAGNPVVAQTIAEASDALQFDLGKLMAQPTTRAGIRHLPGDRLGRRGQRSERDSL